MAVCSVIHVVWGPEDSLDSSDKVEWESYRSRRIFAAVRVHIYIQYYTDIILYVYARIYRIRENMLSKNGRGVKKKKKSTPRKINVRSAGLLILSYILLFIMRVYVIIYYKREIIDAAAVVGCCGILFFSYYIKLTVSVDYRRHVSPRALRTIILCGLLHAERYFETIYFSYAITMRGYAYTVYETDTTIQNIVK